MFRRFPLFQRLITWTKPHAPAERGTRPYEWYDWNSLIGEEPDATRPRPLVHGRHVLLPLARRDGARPRGLRGQRAASEVRYGCRWEATRRDGDNAFVVETADGEYRCKALIVAVGMTRAVEAADPRARGRRLTTSTCKPVREYAGKRVLVIGKRNSGFEIADGLLPWASQIVLASPRPARISVLVHSTAAARARYLQPYEDHVLGGGNVVLDAATERVERTANGYRAMLQGHDEAGRPCHRGRRRHRGDRLLDAAAGPAAARRRDLLSRTTPGAVALVGEHIGARCLLRRIDHAGLDRPEEVRYPVELGCGAWLPVQRSGCGAAHRRDDARSCGRAFARSTPRRRRVSARRGDIRARALEPAVVSRAGARLRPRSRDRGRGHRCRWPISWTRRDRTRSRSRSRPTPTATSIRPCTCDATAGSTSTRFRPARF